jgi:hypothetical protein
MAPVHPKRLKVFSFTTVAVLCGALLFSSVFEQWQPNHNIIYIPITSLTSFVIGWYLSKKHYVSDSYL